MRVTCAWGEAGDLTVEAELNLLHHATIGEWNRRAVPQRAFKAIGQVAGGLRVGVKEVEVLVPRRRIMLSLGQIDD